MRRFSPRAHQHGVALILVLGLMAVIALLATQLTGKVDRHLDQTVILRDLDQARWYARAGEVYAQTTLEDLVTKALLETEDKTANFPISGEGQSGFVSYQLTASHTCLNLNSLTIDYNATDANTKAIKAVWSYALDQIAGVDNTTAAMFIQRASDWMDDNSEPQSPYGAESLFYTDQTPPYQPTNQPMVALDEAKRLNVLNDEEWQAIKPYLCLRPSDSELAINPNDLTEKDATLLVVLSEGLLDEAAALNVIESRPDDGYESIDDFYSLPALAEAGETFRSAFTLERHYFTLDTQVLVGQSPFRILSLLHVDSNGKTAVLSRRLGVTP
jgi:general secretion pathway protein K